MEEKNIFRMLNVLQHNGNIMGLIEEGYEFGQLANFIDFLIENKYIHSKHEILTTTEQGESFLSKYKRENTVKEYSKWIVRREEKWKEPIGKYDYIPW